MEQNENRTIKAVCALPDLDKKPLPILDTELTFTVKPGWDGHAIGVCIGRILEDKTKESFVKKDKDEGSTEIFDYMLSEYKPSENGLIEKHVTNYIDGMLTGSTMYFVPYLVKDHSSMIPTVADEYVDSCSNVRYDITYELLFVADDGYRRYITVNYKTEGTFAASLWDQIKDLEETIDEWTEAGTLGIRYDKETEERTIPFFDETGEKADIPFINAEDLLSMLSSVRQIRFERTIIEPKEKKD